MDAICVGLCVFMDLEVMSAKGKHQKSPTTVNRSHGHLADVTEVWLICAPGEKTPKATWDAVNKATLKPSKSLSTNFKFHIPDLKAGIFICIPFLHKYCEFACQKTTTGNKCCDCFK